MTNHTAAKPKPSRTKSKSVAPCPASGTCHIIGWALTGLGSPAHQFCLLYYRSPATQYLASAALHEAFNIAIFTIFTPWMTWVTWPSAVASWMWSLAVLGGSCIGFCVVTLGKHFIISGPHRWLLHNGSYLSVTAASSVPTWMLSCLEISFTKQINLLSSNLASFRFLE